MTALWGRLEHRRPIRVEWVVIRQAFAWIHISYMSLELERRYPCPVPSLCGTLASRLLGKCDSDDQEEGKD